MLLAFGVIAVLLGCLQVIEFYEASQVQTAIEVIQRDALVSVRMVDRVAMDVLREQIFVGEHIFEKDAAKMAKIEPLIAAARADYVATARAYSPLTRFSGEAFAWHELTADVAAAQAAENAALARSRQNRDVEASAMMAQTKQLFDKIDQDATTLVDINERAAEMAARRATDRHRFDSLVQLLVTAGILVLVVLGGMWITRIVLRGQRDLELANVELENRNRELDAFAGRIAHDLRSPLNTINLSVEMLGLTVPAAKPMSASVMRGVTRIARLIDDLLVLSRVGVMPRTTSRTDPIAASLEDDLGRLVAEHAGSLRIELQPAEVWVSEALLRQVLWNLGENAVKYRRADAAPTLAIEGRIAGGHYVIRVADNGLGMSEEDAQHAFEPFYRSEHTSSIAGTGLGLAIVRRIVEASGGRIALDTRLGHGTTFTITLPRPPQA
jgi:signal transduction histidine kinase